LISDPSKLTTNRKNKNTTRTQKVYQVFIATAKQEMGLEKKKHTPKQNRTSISSPARNVSLPLKSNTSTTPSRGLSQGKAAL